MKYFIYLSIIFLISKNGFAQTFLPEKTVSRFFHFANEPAIAINPVKTNYEIIATNTRNVYRSKNSGIKFRHKKAKSPLGVYGDPVVQYDDKGTCYFVHLSKTKGKKWPDCFEQIVLQETTNNGKTWSSGIGVGKNGKMQDKAWISIDKNKQSKYYGNLYITWTQFDKYGSKNVLDSSRIFFAMYNKKQNNFTIPIQLNAINGDCVDSDNTVEGATTCIGKNGEIYCTWAAFEQLFFTTSLDGGKTWTPAKTIANIPKGWDLKLPDFFRTNGLPFIAIDKQQTLYVCSAYEQNGKNKIALFAKNSTEEHFNEVPFYAIDTQAHYMMPHAYLDETTGNYYILYYRVKNKLVDVLLSYKKNNSNTFNTIQINTKSFPVPKEYIFFGDYINVCAVNNIVAATWTETKGRLGTTFVKTRRILLD